MPGVANKNIFKSSLKLNVDKALSGLFNQKKPYSLACICLCLFPLYSLSPF